MAEQTNEKITENVPQENSVYAAADDKFKRKVVAFTVGAVVLLTLLLILMCYQIVKISVQNRRKAELTNDITEMERQLEDGEETIEIMRKKWWIVYRARQLGYTYESDI